MDFDDEVENVPKIKRLDVRDEPDYCLDPGIFLYLVLYL